MATLKKQTPLKIGKDEQSPRIRRPFSCSAAKDFEEFPFGGIPILESGDVGMRIVEFSRPATGIQVTAGFDIVFVKNTDERLNKMLAACERDSD